MLAKRLCASTRTQWDWPGNRRGALHHAESFLLVVVGFLLLLVAGVWLSNAVAGGTPPVMAEITVKPGDTLWAIAQTYGDPDTYILERVDAVVRANRLRRGSVLREGQRLIVPVTNRTAQLYYGGTYASREIAD